MKAEILFPELGNLNGDLMNVQYLAQCSREITIVNTQFGESPACIDEKIALVYMGTATESGLKMMADSLRPYRRALQDRIEAGQRVLLTGNAQDIFGSHIEISSDSRIDGLAILPFYAKYDMRNRHNSLYLGRYGQIEIVGFKNVFGHTYPHDGACPPLFQTLHGVGRSGGKEGEGYLFHNLMACALTGPLLVLNPPYTQQLLCDIGAEPKLAFEETAMEAYRMRVQEFKGLRAKDV